jgi:hypothetical protein
VEKLFSVAEADRLLPQLQPLLAKVQDAGAKLRDLNTRIAALVQQHTEAAIDQEGNPDRAAYWDLVRQARAQEEQLQEALDEVLFLGAEVKDLDLGLVDFRHKRGGEVVYLCWRVGEPRIAYWHDLKSGFAGRRPLEELEQRRG